MVDHARSLPRVAIVSHNAFGALRGGQDGHAGGVEHQTAMLARWLAARGYEVSFIVWGEGAGPGTRIDGVRVIETCRRDAGLPGLRFVHPRWTSLGAALAAADADVYYHNCAEYVTGQVALFCGRRGRAFVYSAASDPDCDPRLPALRHWRERVLYRYGLRRAARIIVQSEPQRRMLAEGWGLDAQVLPMPCAGPDTLRAPDPWRDGAPRVVWVGRISPEKRLDRLVDVARSLPQAVFEVAGPLDGDDGVSSEWMTRARATPNVRLLGRVPRDRMASVYADAAGLLCTSDYEGFPNTFLEAWSHGVPVVSTVDPDGLIARHGLGDTAGDAAALARALERLLSDRARWRSASAAARRYFEDRHTPDRVLPLFERVLVEAARSSSTWGSTARAAVPGVAP